MVDKLLEHLDEMSDAYTLKATYQGTGNSVKTVTGSGLLIQNRGSNILTLTVNNMTILVDHDFPFNQQVLNFGSFESVSIAGECDWQLFIYE